MNIFEWSKVHKKQPVSIWSIMDQKTVDIVRSVYVTDTGSAYAKYKGEIVALRGCPKLGWHGNW